MLVTIEFSFDDDGSHIAGYMRFMGNTLALPSMVTATPGIPDEMWAWVNGALAHELSPETAEARRKFVEDCKDG